MREADRHEWVETRRSSLSVASRAVAFSSEIDSITVSSVRYFDTRGDLLREYVPTLLPLKPLESG